MSIVWSPACQILVLRLSLARLIGASPSLRGTNDAG